MSIPLNMPRTPQSTPERLTGTLLRLNFVELVIQAADRRVIQMTLPANPRLTRNSEDGRPIPVTAAAFEPGDQVTVQTQRDNQNWYHAEKLQLEAKGGAEEKTAAAQTLDDAYGTDMTTQAVFGGTGTDPVIDTARAATVAVNPQFAEFHRPSGDHAL